MSFISCGKQASTSLRLEVASSFIIDNNSFGGGLIVVGQSSTGKSFSLALDGSRSGTLELDHGEWTFSAIGWDGGSNNKKFEGATHCGFSKALLNEAEKLVEITVNSSRCTETAVISALALRDVKTTTCGAFYTYTKNSDTFSALTAAAPDDFCESSPSTGDPLPQTLQNTYSYYRVMAANGTNGDLKTHFVSECHPILTTLKLPTQNIPFYFRFFKNLNDCTSNSSFGPVYLLPKGLKAGNSSKFDIAFHDQTAPSSRLVLSSNMTRRGYSPLMSMIPRILCLSSGNKVDCLPNVDTQNWQVNVPYHHDDDKDSLLYKNVGESVTSCPANFLSGMHYFNLKDCHVKDGHIFGKVTRNKLTCQNPTEFTSIVDIYLRNDLLYVLDNVNSDSIVHVFTLKGEKLHTIKHPANSFNSLAVDNQQNIWLAESTTLVKYGFNPATNDYQSFAVYSYSGSAIAHIEVTPDGNYLFIGESGSIKTFLASDLTISLSSVFFSGVKQIQLFNNKLYAISATQINTYDHTSGLLSNEQTPQVGMGNAKSFFYDGVHRYYILEGDAGATPPINPGFVKLNPDETFASGIQFPISPSYGGMVAKNGIIYAALGSNVIKVYDSSSSAMIPTYISNNDCNEPNFNTSVTVGSSTATLNIHSKPQNGVYELFSEGLDLIGRRDIIDQSARYYFPSLHPHGNEVQNGGRLRRAQQMLAPSGIASFYSDFSSCNDLYSAAITAGAAGIVRSQSMIDPMNGLVETYSAKVKALNGPIDTYLCQDNNSSASSCNATDTYQLEMTFGSTSSGKNEQYRMLLACNRKLGLLESYDEASGKSRRDLIKWNTSDVEKARFEQYELSEMDNKYARLTRLEKTGAMKFFSRTIIAHIRPGLVEAGVKQYHLNLNSGSNSEFFSRDYYLSGSNVSNFQNPHPGLTLSDGQPFDTIRDSVQFNSLGISPSACTLQTTSNVQVVSSCNVFSFPWFNSTAMSENPSLDLKASSLINFENSSHSLRDVFKLAP